MKKPLIEVGTAEKETFVSCYLLRFPNGLVLRTTGDMAWMGMDERTKVKEQFAEVLTILEKNGFDLGGIALRNLR